jgi:hypothetical protein
MTGKITPLRKRDIGAVQAAAGAFLSSPRHTRPAAATPACPASCSPGSAPAFPAAARRLA